jgi:predicted nucleic acid-binding protein
MEFVFDADVLSTFAKIKKLDLLGSVFGKNKLLITQAVSSDLKRSKSPLVKNVLKSKLFQHVNLNKQEYDLARKIHAEKGLGIGESECIALCKIRNATIVTNDNKAIQFAEKLNINLVDLETILYSLKDLISREQLEQIINDIEAKDKVVVVNKEEILKKSSRVYKYS